MCSLISCGTFDKKLLKITLIFIFIFILLVIIAFSFDAIPQKNNENSEGTKNDHKLVDVFMYYIGQLLCIIPAYFIQYCFKREKTLDIKSGKSNIKLIYNDQSIFNFFEKMKTIFICLLSLIILLSITLYTDNALNEEHFKKYFNKLDFNAILFFFYISFFVISKYIYDQKYYKHQYCSIIILIIIELIKFIVVVIKKNMPIKNVFLVLLITFFFCLIESSINAFRKYLMESKNFTIYKTCFIFGCINIPIVIILCIILTFIPCELFCEVKYNDKKYFENFFTFSEDFNFYDLIIYFLASIVFGFFGIMINAFISNYSLFHIMLPISLCVFILEVYANLKKIENILIVISDVFEIILILTFLESIELNFLGLSYNTKKNIVLRSSNESHNILNDIKDDDKSEDSNDYEENIEIENKLIINEKD